TASRCRRPRPKSCPRRRAPRRARAHRRARAPRPAARRPPRRSTLDSGGARTGWVTVRALIPRRVVGRTAHGLCGLRSLQSLLTRKGTCSGLVAGGQAVRKSTFAAERPDASGVLSESALGLSTLADAE